LTDWTKDDVDEDSKFWNWMEKDKENYNKKHPRKLEKQEKKKKKIIVLALMGLALVVMVFGILSSNNEFGSEKYFYIPDYRQINLLYCVSKNSQIHFFLMLIIS